MEGIDLLPQQAIDELHKWYVTEGSKDKVEVVEDPKVIGTYAIQVTRVGEGRSFHLLWSAHYLEEVEFETWPPESGEPKFFI